MPHRGRLPAVLVGLGVLLFAWVAEAQRVALVRPPDTDAALLEVFNRLSAELKLQDFEVAILDTGGDVRTAEGLAEVARRTSSVAAVRFFHQLDNTAVDVWLGNRAGGSTAMQTIAPPGGLDAPNVLAIRTVDLLRTNLREFGGGERAPPPPSQPPPPRETKPPPQRPPPPPERPPNWRIRAEAIVLWNRPSLGAAYGASLGLGRRITDHLEVGLFAAGPVVLGTNWATPEGTASMREELGWAELRYSGWSLGPLVVGTSVGAGVMRVEVQGIRPAELSRPDQTWSFAALLAGHIALPLGGNAAIGMTLRAIGLTPRPAVGIGSTITVVQFPLLGASAGLLVAF